MRSAYQWGMDHGSCPEALTWRESLGARATQADAWERCERGDWLLWQLKHGLTASEYAAIRPVVARVVEGIVERAILVAHHALVARGVECPAWEVWAYEWVTGEDRSWSADAAAAVWLEVAGAAAAAADWASAWVAARAAAAAACSAADAVCDAAARWSAADAAADDWASAWVAADAAELSYQADEIRAAIGAWKWEV